VDDSIREACHGYLYENCKPVQGKIPANILLSAFPHKAWERDEIKEYVFVIKVRNE